MGKVWGEGGQIYYKLYICDNINSFRVMIDELVGGKTKNLIPYKNKKNK